MHAAAGKSFRSAGFLAASALALLAGCGGEPTGHVQGKVTIDGEPVRTLGSVALQTADGRVVNSNLNDGVYSLPQAPLGPARLSVVVRPLPVIFGNPAAGKTGSEAPPPAKFVPIPERYTDPARSGLTYTVKPGEQTFDISLSSK